MIRTFGMVVPSMDTPFPAKENLKKPPVVVLGAGYVGSAVVREALARGHEVVALTRNTENARVLESLGARVVLHSLDSNSWHALISSEGAWVVNCVSGGGAGLEGYQKSYYRGMASVLAWAALASPPEALVYTSSTSVYPQGDGATVSESSEALPSSPTAQVLRQTESLLEAGSPCSRWFILRLSGIYGPGRHSILDELKAGLSAFPGTGDRNVNLIHREDIVRAIFACWTSATVKAGIYNVTDDGRQTRAEVVSWLAGKLGLPSPSFLGEGTAGSRNVPHRFISNAKIKANLGWNPHFADFRAGYSALLGA